VTEGAGTSQPSVLEYTYDVLGRRTQQIVDPGMGKLNLTTRFKYDANGNLTRSIDARGASSWFVYDAHDRVIQTLAPDGALTEIQYDAAGRQIARLEYATRVAPSLLAQFGDVIAAVTVTAHARDRLTQSIFDGDDREAFTVDAAGAVTERTFDAQGEVIRVRRYAKAIAGGSYSSLAAVRAALTAAGNDPAVIGATDQVTWTAYDVRGQSIFEVDAAGAVARLVRDEAGNVVRSTAFASLRSRDLPMDLASLTSWAEQSAVATHQDNRIERFWHDAAGRTVFKRDAAGYLQQTVHNDAARTTSTISYRDQVSVGATSLAQLQAHSVVTGFNPAYDRVGTVEQDKAGRLIQVYDALQASEATALERYEYDARGNRITTVDARGHVTRRTFDAAGREVTVTDALGGITTKAYNATGQVVKLTDGRGVSGYTFYDARGEAVYQIDPGGYVSRLTRDAFSNVIEEIAFATALSGAYHESTPLEEIASRLSLDAVRDRTLTRVFDARGLLESVTYHNTTPYTEAFKYNAFGEQIESQNRNGAVTSYAYNTRGERVSVLGPPVEVVTAVFPTPTTQTLRLETVYEYSAFGEVTRVLEAAGTEQQRETHLFYDPRGLEVRIQGPAFEVYDRASNLFLQRTPETLKSYDATGNLITEVAPNGARTVHYYNVRNQRIATVSPEGVLSEFDRDAVGNEIATRIFGTRLTGTLDVNVRPIPVDPEDYRELKYEFDANDRRIKTETRAETLYSVAKAADPESDGDGYYFSTIITLARYDANGNVTQTTDGNGHVVRHYYDGVGNKLLSIDEAGYVTHWQYNAQGQVIREARLAGKLDGDFLKALTPTSSTAAILTAVPVGEDRITEFKYDALGRQIEARQLAVTYTTVDANDGRPTTLTADVVTTSSYDGNGNLVAQTRADGGRFDFTYDALDRKSSQLDPEFQAFIARGQALATVRSQQLIQYDAHGNVAVELALGANAEANRPVLQRFDTAGNLRERSEPGGASFTYDYDVSANTLRTTRAVRDVEGVLHQYRSYASFDALDREISRQDIADQFTAAQEVRETQDVRYNAFGDIEAKGRNGQFQEQFIYDRLGRLFFTHEKGAATLFVYDANGNAVLKIKGLTTDVTQVLDGGVLRPIRGPEDASSFLPTREQITTSFYDERNLLITVADAPMNFGTLLASQPEVGERPAVVEALRAAALSVPTALVIKNPINGTLIQDPAPVEVTRNNGPVMPSFGTPNPQMRTPLAYVDPRTAVPPNFGVVVGNPEIRSTPEVLPVSNDYDEALGERTVVQKILQTIIRTKLEVTATAVIKTITTERPVVTRTTVFKRERTETVAEDEESLSGEIEVTRTETTHTSGTVNVFVETTTQSLMTERLSTYVHSSQVEGVVNLLASVPLTINVDSVPVNQQQQPELDAEVDIGVFVNGPAIAGFGSDHPFVSAQIGGHGAVTQQSNGAISFQTSRRGTQGEGAHVTVTKGGYTLLSDYFFNAPPQTLQLGPFLSLKELPPDVSVELVLIKDDGSKTAPLASIYSGGGGGPRELVFAEPYPGAFTPSRRYEYTLRGANGAIRNVIGGKLDGSERGAAITTQTNTFTLQELKNTSNVNGSLDQPDGAPPSPEQQTYLLNLIRTITEGTPSEYTIKRDQTYNAFREVITQTDGHEKTTELYYDKLGNLVRQVQPETLIYPQAGAAFEGRPTTHYLYNQLSELVGTQDANSVALSADAPYYSTRVLVNGRVEKEFNADGKLTRHVYDSLGNERQQFDALDQETAYTYDLAGRLLSQDRYQIDGVRHSYDSYKYDVAGNRTEHTNSLGHTERYLLDDQNRITRYTSFTGRETHYDYQYVSDLAGIGGYEKLTTTAGLDGEDTQVESSDIFGNLRYTRDLGGHEYVYEYNNAGLLSRQTGTTAAAGRNAQDIHYKYFLNGLIESIDDLGISAYSKFQYDQNGNRTREIYSRVAIVAGLQDVHPHQVAYAEYDELNRLVRASEAGRFDIRYTYDAVGNRRSVKSDYFDLLRQTEQTQEFYYKYDKLNRFTVTLGQKDANGEIISGTTGYDITYDALDRRTSATSRLLNKTTHVPEYVREEYQYDRIGTVKRVDIYDQVAVVDETGLTQQVDVRVGGSTRQNSPLGSLLEYIQFKVEGGSEIETRKTRYDYDADQRVRHEITVNNRDNNNRERSDYNYEGDGILTSTVASTIDQSGNTITSAGSVTTHYAYEKWDTYKESTVTSIVQGPRDWRMGSSLYTYDANGHIAKLFDVQASRTLEYVNNQNGQVLKRSQIDREGDGSDKPAEIRNFYYLNGRGIGDTGTDRVESRVDYAQQLAEQEKKDKKGRTSQINPQLAQRISPVTSADFDQNFRVFNEGFPARVAGTHIVQRNETLQSIAASMYGDASLWYLIADANGLTGNEALPVSLRLTIPNVGSVNSRNNAETFRPYDVEAALGKTDPTLPPPPPPPSGKKGCGGVGTILVIAVAVIAATLTAGVAATAAAGLFGGTGVAAGVAGAVAFGAVYSTVTQGVLIAAGLQQKFSFKDVAIGAVSQLASFGLDSLVEAGKLGGAIKSIKDTNHYAYTALRGAASSALTQGISVAAGLQKSFSWREVALAAVTAPVARFLGEKTIGLTGVGRLDEIIGNVAGSLGSSGVRAIAGERVTSRSLLQDLGRSLGNTAAGYLTDSLSRASDRVPTAAEAARQETDQGTSTGSNFATNTSASRVASGDVVAEGSATVLPVVSDGEGIIQEVVVTDRRFTYAENLEYHLLRSPFYFIRADGVRGGGYVNNDDDFVSQLALDRVAYSIRKSYRNEQDFEFAARNLALAVDTLNPYQQAKRFLLETANAGIHLAGGIAGGLSYLQIPDSDYAASVRDTIQGLRIDYDSPFNEAVAVGLADEVAAVRGASIDLIGERATGVVGEGLHYLFDVAALVGTYASFRNTGLALSLEETGHAGLQGTKALGLDLLETAYLRTLQPSEPGLTLLKSPLDSLLPESLFVVPPGGGGRDAIRLRSPLQEKPGRILDANGNRIPLGFNSVDDLNAFTDALIKGLPEGTNIVFKGSSVTGRNFRTGKAFDVDRTSDFDIGLVNDDLFLQALQLGRSFGFKYKTSPNRIGPLTEGQLEIFGIDRLRRTLSERSGRNVNFQLYESVKEALKRDSIVVQ
jgi:YD repeat-containing protein